MGIFQVHGALFFGRSKVQGTITSIVDDLDLTEIIGTLKYQFPFVPSDSREETVFLDLEHGINYQSGTIFYGFIFLIKVLTFVLQGHEFKIRF